MRRCIRYSLTILALVSLLLSCNNSSNPDRQFKIKPSALGVMNEIVVITDDDLWESIVGDTVRHFFEGVFPLTPRPEPIFDIRQYDPSDIYSQPLKKELRTYFIIANLDDIESETTKFVIKDLGEERLRRAKTDPNFNTSVGRDKWANGQILVYLFAHGTDNLAAAVERNYNGISGKVNDHDRIQLEQVTYARGRNNGLKSNMLGRYGAEIEIPNDFNTVLNAPEDHGLYWFRKDTKDGAFNMAFRIFDYTGPEMVTKEAMKERFNDFGRYVSSKEPNTFILINDVDLPILEFERTISTRYTKECRGIWEMENDFMGGPFISYAIVNEKTGKLLVIDSFVFAPGKRKRDILQQVDLIVKGIKW